jgi:hypothetical protein
MEGMPRTRTLWAGVRSTGQSSDICASGRRSRMAHSTDRAMTGLAHGAETWSRLGESFSTRTASVRGCAGILFQGLESTSRSLCAGRTFIMICEASGVPKIMITQGTCTEIWVSMRRWTLNTFAKSAMPLSVTLIRVGRSTFLKFESIFSERLDPRSSKISARCALCSQLPILSRKFSRHNHYFK